MKHALAAACLALAASPAAAQMLDTSPEGIMNVARGFGTAQLETSSGGQPMVVHAHVPLSHWHVLQSHDQLAPSS